MQVILLDKIGNQGSLGDTVNVKSGYARNFIIPQGKAVMATKANVAMFESRRAELEAKLMSNWLPLKLALTKLTLWKQLLLLLKQVTKVNCSVLSVLVISLMQSRQLAFKYLRAKFAYLKVLCATLVLTKLAFNFTLKFSQPQKYKLLLSYFSY